MKSLSLLILFLAGVHSLPGQPRERMQQNRSITTSAVSDNVLKIVSTPNPSLFPLLLAMADDPSLPVELIAVGKSSELVEKLNGTADGEISMTYVAANQMVKGSVSDMRLLEVVYWSGFYEITAPSVTSFTDLKGKKLVVSGPVGSGMNGGPDLIFKAALKREGLTVDDFEVSYMPVNEGTEKVMSGAADAILLVEPAGTGMEIMSKMKPGTKLEKTIDIQKLFTGYNSWESNLLPLGGLSIKNTSLEDSEKKLQIEKLRKAYLEAADKMNDISFSDARKISSLLKTYYGDLLEKNIPPMVIKKASTSGNYIYRSGVNVRDIQKDLNAFITEILEESPPNSFYE